MSWDATFQQASQFQHVPINVNNDNNNIINKNELDSDTDVNVANIANHASEYYNNRVKDQKLTLITNTIETIYQNNKRKKTTNYEIFKKVKDTKKKHKKDEINDKSMKKRQEKKQDKETYNAKSKTNIKHNDKQNVKSIQEQKERKKKSSKKEKNSEKFDNSMEDETKYHWSNEKFSSRKKIHKKGKDHTLSDKKDTSSQKEKLRKKEKHDNKSDNSFYDKNTKNHIKEKVNSEINDTFVIKKKIWKKKNDIYNNYLLYEETSPQKKKRKTDKDKYTSSPEKSLQKKTENSVLPSQQPDANTLSFPSFPYPTDPNDHSTSPFLSYIHIQPFLQHLLQSISTSPSKVSLYDPYYCNGSPKFFLKEIGYTNVIHELQDCYDHWNDIQYDILITNPPYSGNHIQLLLHYLTHEKNIQKPSFLLLPIHIHKKEYFKKLCNLYEPIYLLPIKRYVYIPPKKYRERKESKVHVKNSPFVSMWYIWGGSNEKTKVLYKMYKNRGGELDCQVARSKSELRDCRRKKIMN